MSPNPADGDAYDHPNVVGTISSHKVIGDGGRGVKDGDGDPTHTSTVSIGFGGKDYQPTGKTGKSLHDDTPVHEFEAEDGHRVWADGKGRVHAGSKDEVGSLRKLGQQSSGGELDGLKKHPMWSEPDYDYLHDKGYSHDAIKALWDRDHKSGKAPVLVNKDAQRKQLAGSAAEAVAKHAGDASKTADANRQRESLVGRNAKGQPPIFAARHLHEACAIIAVTDAVKAVAELYRRQRVAGAEWRTGLRADSKPGLSQFTPLGPNALWLACVAGSAEELEAVDDTTSRELRACWSRLGCTWMMARRNKPPAVAMPPDLRDIGPITRGQ